METFLCKQQLSFFIGLIHHLPSKKTHFLCFITFLALLPTASWAAENEQRIPSTITNVTVFINQAQVTRLAKVNLQAGITNLVFDRVSPFINLNSIQVKTDHSVALLSVSQRNNYLTKEEKPSYVSDLIDTLDALKNHLQLLHIKKEAIQIEREVLLNNKKIGGDNSGTKIEDLEDALQLFRKKMQETGEELMKLNASEKKILELQQKLQSQLDEYNNNENSATEIVVTVKCLSPLQNVKIEWSYLVTGANWRPFYDIRVKDTQSEFQLVSKAFITQNTGESWKNVVLKLSTANPNESGNKPALTPLYLRYQNYQLEDLKSLKQTYRNAPAAEGKAAEAGMAYTDGNDTLTQTQTNIEFNVTSAYTIPSDNNPHQVDLTVSSIKAEYAYVATPKIDKDAFVTAKVSGNDLMNQMNGEANVYFYGTFTGKTYLTGTTQDSMLVSLGRDKRIQIQRNLLKDFSSKNFTGNVRKELSTWEISLRNTRKEAIVIWVEDQIPVSTDKEIEVKLISAGNGTLDEATGKLTWLLKLEPEQTQTLRFSFEVKYPKEKIVTPY
jgi:uncharacterized protein (TIGR02231 family)